MKASIYNVVFPYETQMILYNTFSCKSMILDKSLADLLSEHRKNIDAINSIHPDFYHALIDGKYIVENGYDEVEAVEELRLNNLSDKSQYHLTINPTLDCNFHCWYCYESKVKGSEMSPELVQATISFIDYVLADNPELKRFHLYFFGGEPLLKYKEIMWPILDAFIEKTSGKGILCTLQITTNGVLLNDEIIQDIKRTGLLTAFQITFDGYGDHHNKSRFSKEHPKSYELLIKNVKTLIQNGLCVTLRVNYTQKNVDDLQMILKEFASCEEEERSRIVYTPVRIWQDVAREVTRKACKNRVVNELDGQIIAKSNNSIEYASSLGMQIMPINSIDSVRNPCKHSYVNAASINYNGDVFKCCARAFNEENREGLLGSDGAIQWKADTNKRILRKRTEANPPCRKCILFPICGGGCVQSFKDFSNIEYCLYRFDETSKIEAVKRLVSLTQM